MTLPSAVAPTSAWREHVVLAQLLGLCPLLAVTTSVARALGLALATSLVLVATSVLAALVRRLLGRELRLLSHVLIVGALVSGVDFALRAWLPALHAQLATFVPLIATNCVILSRVERCASGAARALRDALAHAAALLPAFVLFGALRELIGHGTLLAGMDALAGGDGSSAGLEVFDGGFLLVGLTPGAFLVLAGFAALHRRLAARPALPGAAAPAAAAG